MAIKNVLFDLGDTLWHFPELPPTDIIRGETMRRISSLLAEWEVPFEGPMRFLGREIRLGVEAADRAHYESDRVSPDFNEVVREIVAKSGLELSYDQAARLWDRWNLGGTLLGRTMFDDAFSTLDWLRDHGYRLGCVTNRVFGGPRFAEEMRELGLDRYFESTVVSCDLGYMKPHPKAYQAALDEMRISAAETAMVGDSLKADVQGAQAVGLTAVWRRRHKPERKRRPEETGEGASASRGATRAETGRALGEFGGGEDAKPDHTIWTLTELTRLPLFA